MLLQLTWCKITYSEEKTIAKFHLYTTRKINESNYCNKNLYCSGECLALLSALVVIAACHDSNVLL